MPKWLIAAGVFVVLLLVAASAGLAFFIWRYPRVGPAPAVHIPATARQIDRGRYLANHVTVCIDCHSARDWQLFSGPIAPDTIGRGGERFGEEFGFPGTFYSANVTPAGIGDWSDGEVLRAITCGVKRDGRAMFPVMPYPDYSHLAEADAEAIVAYLRTLTPVVNDVPPSHFNFPMNLIARTIPQPYVPRPAPLPSDRLAYGKYLVTIAACSECHTPSRQGQPIAELAYAGGAEFAVPSGGLVRSSNITPDSDTGIGRWSEAFFVARFQDFASEHSQQVSVAPAQFNTIMPWTMYAGMTDEDLAAIYAYLRTLKPVRHVVTTFSGAE